ncbi:hypothetical protein HMPREF1978_01561 [Actinomyces graevenitzii F0530]|uniref:Uncharacterized protein n=1 Tax=Actinomyces graevenitzii F0530 TaxID=1321817 RepID=U1PDA3_9ACTO|nr:hypothetical protein HMPREF1978_01561 [Actinomyces graevenitzii F0530]
MGISLLFWVELPDLRWLVGRGSGADGVVVVVVRICATVYAWNAQLESARPFTPRGLRPKGLHLELSLTVTPEIIPSL